jgi:hypothetical protein
MGWVSRLFDGRPRSTGRTGEYSLEKSSIDPVLPVAPASPANNTSDASVEEEPYIYSNDEEKPTERCCRVCGSASSYDDDICSRCDVSYYS